MIKIEFMILRKKSSSNLSHELDDSQLLCLRDTLRKFCDNLENFLNEDSEQESVPCRTCGKFFLIKELIFYKTDHGGSSQCDDCYAERTGRSHPSVKDLENENTNKEKDDD